MALANSKCEHTHPHWFERTLRQSRL